MVEPVPRPTRRPLGSILSWVLALLVAVVMLAGAVGHLTRPDYFATLVPPVFPAALVLKTTALLQIAIGLAALWPRSRALAGLAFALLCTAYLPLHLWDFSRPDPVFPPPGAASLRVLVQIGFVWAGWSLWIRGAR